MAGNAGLGFVDYRYGAIALLLVFVAAVSSLFFYDLFYVFIAIALLIFAVGVFKGLNKEANSTYPKKVSK